jgi:alpha-glucuronidase
MAHTAMTIRIATLVIFGILLLVSPARTHAQPPDDDGYRMWLRYDLIADADVLAGYRNALQRIAVSGGGDVLQSAAGELATGLSGLLGREIPVSDAVDGDGTILIGTPDGSAAVRSLGLADRLEPLGRDGFLIDRTTAGGRDVIVVAGNTDAGVLYGVFHLLRQLQMHRPLDALPTAQAPKVDLRIVNHWDNLNRRSVERGYGGLSLWEWGSLPEYRNPRYTDYARINASIGINATVINNVNADPRMLTDQFLEKTAVLADMFRPWGIRLYLSVNFDSPRRIGGLKTADPLDPDVRAWWRERVERIYSYIPDFGGFLVKADSEGQPGPQGYGRTHADGANMLADALEPHGGIVMWRAFVYRPEQGDRFREAYDEFVPLDGQFHENVIVQVKNGPIDFQPREPFSPLFGAMEKTNTMLELQVTQEYFGFAMHLAYMGTLFSEVLQADTYARGEGSTVGRVIDGSVFGYRRTGMAAVINPGTDRNWTGHPFVQSSWYAFGRLAWDHTLAPEAIADEWIRMTFSNDPRVVEPVKDIMMMSREAGVNYRSPIGLTHLYAQGHHYGPAPWHARSGRPDWTAVYYHRADRDGIGFDRTATGSNAVEQYHEPVAAIFRDLEKIPDEYLLWFHRVPWDHRMKSGRTLWNELVHKYYEGVEQVREMQRLWDSVEGLVDRYRFEQVKALLRVQERDAIRWRDSCVLYFQTFSGQPIPDGYEKPAHSLEHYRSLETTTYVPDTWYNQPPPGVPD